MGEKDIEVCIVGAFPPPVHGMAVVNEKIARALEQRGVQVTILDISARSLERGLLTRFGRIGKIIRCLRVYSSLLGRKEPGGLYVGLSGGFGQLYEWLFVLLARIRDQRIYLHHHSFAYLTKSSFISRLLFWTAGSQAVHVALCEDMARALIARYELKASVAVLSNSALIECAAENGRDRSTLKVIGFLGNISREKGIVEYFEVLDQITSGENEIRGLIAGPFQNREIEDLVLRRCESNTNITYIGPVNGAEKVEFFNSIDVLLFPTKYANEAEPLAVLEAMSYAVPVIAWGRGCIPSIVAGRCGKVVPIVTDFIVTAVSQVLEWQRCPSDLAEASILSSRTFRASREKSMIEFDRFFAELVASIR